MRAAVGEELQDPSNERARSELSQEEAAVDAGGPIETHSEARLNHQSYGIGNGAIQCAQEEDAQPADHQGHGIWVERRRGAAGPAQGVPASR